MNKKIIIIGLILVAVLAAVGLSRTVYKAPIYGEMIVDTEDGYYRHVVKIVDYKFSNKITVYYYEQLEDGKFKVHRNTVLKEEIDGIYLDRIDNYTSAFEYYLRP